MKLKGFTKKQLLDIYRTMYRSRILDKKQLILLKQGKGFFHIGASGHEVAEVAAGINFKPGYDYAYPYYRDQAFCLSWGMTPMDMLLSFLAREEDPNSGGRQMPQHFGCSKYNIVSQSSPTGTQFLQAVGAAFALKRDKSNAVVYVSAGEGTTSQGDYHEALNWASRENAPVVFHIEDNGYAISVPIDDQVSGASVYNISSGYQNLNRYNVDGTDFLETHLAFKDAVNRARNGKGPSVVVSNVVRLLPHSSSDDHRKYRSKEELDMDMERDPINKFKALCIDNGICKDTEFSKIDSTISQEIDDIAEKAELASSPSVSTVYNHLYSENTDSYSGLEINPIQDSIVMVDAINHALAEELENNPKMLVYGQDVAGGKGGVFTATKGLSDLYEDRVFNSPLAESSIIGTAIGLATLGYKPVVEIQFGDYIWTAMMQIRNELATLRYRSNGAWKCPLVVRVPVGGYIHGSLCHSQSIEGYFAHLPGVRIMFPSNATDAKGLLKNACRSDDPVLFFEHKGLYRQPYSSGPEPDKSYLLDIGKARVVQQGSDVTIITWGALVQKSIEAANQSDYSVEVIDLRTLSPLDMDTISDSVGKTNKVIVAHEDNITGGFGAEIAARIGDELFEKLDGPVKRVGSLDVPIAYAANLENEILVQTEWIYNAIESLGGY